jgi:hypothetical protein
MGGCVGLRVGFININDMYNNDVGKGGVRVYEAYEVKQRVALVRVPCYFINLLPTSLLYISILLLTRDPCTRTHAQDAPLSRPRLTRPMLTVPCRRLCTSSHIGAKYWQRSLQST